MMDLGVSYVAAHQPAHIAADMHHLSEIGCTEVLFALQENHIRVLTGALRFGAPIAREHGLRPYAVIWGFANTFGGGRMSHGLLEDRTIWRIDRAGNPQPMACLNNPRLVEQFMTITTLCRDAGFEGMFVDEPTPQHCFCPHCQARFEEQSGGSLQDADVETYQAFQHTSVIGYTTSVCAAIKAFDPRLQTITCLMPPDRDCYAEVAAIPELDVFGSDPYWMIFKNMTIPDAVEDARVVKQICKQQGKRSQVWLNCWRIPAGREEEIYTGGRELAAVGSDSMYAWSFRGGLGTYEACDNPEAAWAQLVRLYRELAGK